MATNFPKLNEREEEILEAVVHLYITTAEPVGSRTVAKRLNLHLSPATIRNVMADLEEMGYLTQVHTSSGRVPTDLGYKYYVSKLMKVQELTIAERQKIEQELTKKLDSAEQILKHTSQLLALASHQAGLAELPNEKNAVIRRIDLIPLGEKQVAVVIVDSFAGVHSSLFTFEETVPSQIIEPLNKFLNEALFDVSLDRISVVLKENLRKLFDERRKFLEIAFRILSKIEPSSSHMILEGANNLFDQPEFQEPGKIKSIFGIIEDPTPLVKALRESLARGEKQRQTVLIGSDANIKNTEEFSVVASPYMLENQDTPIGFVGVLGPKRMPYEKISAIVDYTASMVGKMLSRFWR
ncbi:MAG: heat-inducible transcriptional repressor HrcA [Candidatus Hydrogenedentes bacterium]|nr:heat-inducible transcriptional repressor HrcA [Candidatus Hydrogenedentota bacterium]